MGEHGLMERGATEDFVWEVEPMTGAKVYSEAPEANARRYFAIVRGARPGELYREIASAGTKTLDGREHAVLKMTPKSGKPDTWFVDPATGVVGRIDIGLPTPEGAELVWAMGDDIDAQITFGDWKRVGGVLYPHRRSMKMGHATFVSTCTKIEPNAKIEPDRFKPPEAVTKAKAAAATRKPAGESRPAYEIVDRDAQNVASIRVKCKSEDISATLSVIFPEIMSHLNSEGVRITGVPFTRYHAIDGEQIDLEAGMPVAKPIEEKGRIKNSELPGGRTVLAWHVGPYEKLKEAHEALKGYVAANKLAARGGPWELYWTDPGVVPDPAKWRTQLFLPIEK
jgi:effector-binding domain-containing protein